MKKKGSITVFLALTFGILFSLVLTALEGARLQGATAYLSMLSELAGDSLLAHYYYPLFQEYHLFGVHAGDGNGYFSEDKIIALLQENVEYGMETGSGGLLKTEDAKVILSEYETLLSKAGEPVLAQMREQVLYDGFSMAISRFFTKEMFQEAASAGEIYKKQEETMAELAPVAKELLRLMELADGICTGDRGLELSSDGRLKVADSFLKQIVPVDAQTLKGYYENKEVAEVVVQNRYPVMEVTEGILRLMDECVRLQQELSSLAYQLEECRRQSGVLSEELTEIQKRMAAYEGEEVPEEEKMEENSGVGQEKEQQEKDIHRGQELQYELAVINSSIKNLSSKRDDAVKQLEQTVQAAKKQYNHLVQKLEDVEKVQEEVLQVLKQLERKQMTARISVDAYEAFLEEKKKVLSEELYQVFEQELVTMKMYAGMEEQGYVVEKMREEIKRNQQIFEKINPEGFSEWNFSGIKSEMRQIQAGLADYRVEHFCFTYGTITVSSNTGQNVFGLLQEILAEGVLALAGVSEKEVSERKLTGQDLPSDLLEKSSLWRELLECMEAVTKLFQKEEMGALLEDTWNKALDVTVLGLYDGTYFHCYGEEAPCTKLNYEQEYILCGEMEDESNLFYTVLQLVAVRSLFRMVALLKNPGRMAELEAFSSGVAGLTGIPVLLAVVKYTVLLLWSVEEAFIEVAALLQGKRVPVLDGKGYLSFSEVFLFGKAMIQAKAKEVADSAAGVDYQNYLVLLSLAVPVKEKLYRTLDLIQENIRYRYEDGFRIRNVVVKVEFLAGARLEEKFNLGIFPEELYELKWKEQSVY